MRRLNEYAREHQLGRVEWNEVQSGQHTHLMATVCGTRSEVLASVQFTNRLAIVHMHQPRFTDGARLKANVTLRSAQACKLMRDYYRREHLKRRRVLEQAHAVSQEIALSEISSS